MTIDVTEVNDAPNGLDNTITILEDTPYSFNSGDFGFSDVNDTPPDNFQAVRITTLPTNGTLELSGVPVTAGLLTFSPDLNDNGVGYADFTFQVQDDGGTTNGGVDFDTVPNTITFDVTPVNDAPFDLTLSSTFLPEGISTWNIGTITGLDVDGPALTYTIVAADPSFSITNGNILTNNGTKTFGVDPDTYSITLRVNDGFLSYDETFTINLIPEPVIIDNNDPSDLASNILNETGVDITTEQLAEIFGLDVVIYDLYGAETIDDDDNASIKEEIIYETNSIYKALVELNTKDNNDEANSDDKDGDIADKSKQSQRQYFHKQLDEAALYYQSKNAQLIKALGKSAE